MDEAVICEHVFVGLKKKLKNLGFYKPLALRQPSGSGFRTIVLSFLLSYFLLFIFNNNNNNCLCLQTV